MADNSNSESEDRRPNKRTSRAAGKRKLVESEDEEEEEESQLIERTPSFSSSDDGTIESIEIQNFMCHSRFSMQFGSKNGSGKSAILTAITICLGGKANFTQRASSIKTLLKNDCTSGHVTLSLRNAGVDAFKPEEYGKSIIITRKITSDSSSYKICAANGRVVSTLKDEIDQIKDHFNISIDNPLTVLTQDTARSFLANSTPKDLYNFFMKGTLLDDLKADYEKINATIGAMDLNVCRISAEHQRVRKSYKEAKEKFEEARSNSVIEDELEGLRKMKLCANLENQVANIESLEAKISRYQIKLDSYTEMEQQCADDIEPKETLYNEAKTLVREKSVAHNLLTDKKKELNENLGVARKKYGEYENEKIKMNQQLSTLRKNIQRFEEQIKEINNANETMKSDRDRLIKNEQIERHEAEIEAINREITKAKEDVDELDKAKPSLNDKSYEARNAVDNAKRELDIIRRDIQNAKQGKGNKFSAYHKNMQRLYESVEIMDRERKWTGFTPIGPLGLHISLKDNYYSTVIESELRSILACFIVANHEDRKRLNEAMRRAGCETNIFLAGKNTGNKFYELFEKNQPSQEFQTIYRAIEVANDLVLRTLIINARIEGTILIKDMEVGNKVCANGLPQNSNKVLTREYQSMGMRGGGDQTLSLNKYNGSYRLSENADGHIKELESSFSTLENKIRALERVFDEANRLFRKNGDNAENLKQLIISKSSQVRSLKRTVTTLKDSINDDDIHDPSPIEAEKRNAEAEIVAIGNQFEVLVVNIEESSSEKANLHADVQKLTNEINDLFAEKGVLVEKEAEKKHYLEEARKALDHAKQKKISYIEKNKVTVEEFETAKSFYDNFMKTLWKEEYAAVEVVMSEEDIQKKINTLLARQKALVDEYGDVNLLKKDADEKGIRLNHLKRTSNTLLHEMNYLKVVLEGRVEYFDLFQKTVIVIAKQNFTQMMAIRNFTGMLSVDHGEKILELDVSKIDSAKALEPEAKKAKKIKDSGNMKSLSGGEKSYATICLLLSLWENIETPFRALDEFDVFMDAVNRKQSMLQMIEFAKDKGNQYIFITPQDMSHVPGLGGPNLRVQRMPNPERGQQILQF